MPIGHMTNLPDALEDGYITPERPKSGCYACLRKARWVGPNVATEKPRPVSDRVASLQIGISQEQICKEEGRREDTRALVVDSEVPIHIFTPPDFDALLEALDPKTPNLKVLFSGIFRTILLASDSAYNKGEMTLFYGSKESEGSDPVNILFYDTESRFVAGWNSIKPYLGVTFNRLLVRPCGYAIRSDWHDSRNRESHHLKTFVFQGRKFQYDWVTLDEQVNIPTLQCEKSHFFAFVDTAEYYSEFRILQTGVSHNGDFMFSISAFEIHGDVKKRDV